MNNCNENLFFLQLGFVLLALIWEYDFPPFMVLIIAILNDGTLSSQSKMLRPSENLKNH